MSPSLKPSSRRSSLSLLLYFGSAMWAVSMLTLWVAAGLFLWWTNVNTEQQVRTMARTVASTVAITVGEVWSSPPMVEVPVHQASRQDGIAFIKVRLPHGGLRMSAGDPGVSPDKVWVESAPITMFNESLGTVEVGVLRSIGAALVRPWVWTTVGITLSGTLLVTLAALMVSARTTRPLEQLRRIAVRWEEPLEVDPKAFGGPRELEELAEGLLSMRERALAKKAELEREVAAQTEELASAYAALERSFQETAASLAKALDARDRMTANHSIRTAELAGRLGVALQLGEAELRTLVLAATLHDVGKIGVPESVLLKKGPLTPEEWRQMKYHPVIGAAILQEVTDMADLAEIVRHHHERWDGYGYPDGLKEEEIPYLSRIITVADSIEAMCARRLYREPLPAGTVLAEVERCAGSQFDPVIVTKGWAGIVETVHSWCPSELCQSTH